jgi:signal transduction histidine kinase
MHDWGSDTDRWGWREVVLLLALAAVPVVGVLTLAGRDAVPTAALVTSVVAGVFFVVAALLFYLDWRVRPDPHRGWLAAAMVLLACEVLTSAAMALDPLVTERARPGWPLLVDLVVIATVVVLASIGLREEPPRTWDPLLLGLGLGVVAASARLLLPALDQVVPVRPAVLVALVMVAHGALAATVLLNRALSPSVAWRLAATVGLVSLGHVVASHLVVGTMLDLTASTLQACAAILWTSATFVLLRSTLDDQRRRGVELESSLLSIEATARGTREALHEVKSTVAGLATASRLLADNDVPDDVRQRLEQTMTRELARMERLLWLPAHDSPAVIDLDHTLDSVLDLHRVRGRSFTWEPTGAQVVGLPDAIAEAVNILLDNAATHGDASSGRVDVSRDETDEDMVRIAVSDGGPGVPTEMRQRIFEWGERGASSRGQGIGLHVAQRLVAEQGGSLTLGDDECGSSFVIKLPAARTSEENHGARAEHSAS